MSTGEQYRKVRLEKRTNYSQVAFEIRQERPGFKSKVVPQVMSAFGRGLKEILKELENIFKKMICVKGSWQKCRK